jgi:hypothetical protein
LASPAENHANDDNGPLACFFFFFGLPRRVCRGKAPPDRSPLSHSARIDLACWQQRQHQHRFPRATIGPDALCAKPEGGLPWHGQSGGRCLLVQNEREKKEKKNQKKKNPLFPQRTM